ncbi:MAG: hypothetical protein HKN79_12270 [Flavobacteriales bacterium]|nr:hypothetical protein [Flavobacteriales bacterium]
MSFFDIIATVFYFILILGVGLIVRGNKSQNPLYRKYFMSGLFVKLFGGLAFALVYTYYYTYGGDTKTYFHDSSYMVSVFLESPLDYWRIIWASTEQILADYYEIQAPLRYNIGTPEWFTVKISSVATLLGLNSYFSTSLIFAGLSYTGIWNFFRLLCRRYPKAHREIAYAVLFVPSVFFWGSGIMKDSIVIGFLGHLIYYVDSLISAGVLKRIGSSIIIIICSYIIFEIKPYVLITIIPAIIIWIVMNVRDGIRNWVVRSLVFPMLLAVSIFGIAYSVTFIGQFSSKYNVDSVFKTAQSMQSWHYVEGKNTSDQHGRGSSYSLGEYEPDLAGTLKMFIPAVNVTFFRPYLWEVKNVAMLAAAIESTAIFLFSFFIFLGLGFFRVLRILNKDAFLLMTLSFAITFGFAVGFTSYNFGALVRYKIPCIPFYLSTLVILRHKVKELKQMKAAQVRRSSSPTNASISLEH